MNARHEVFEYTDKFWTRDKNGFNSPSGFVQPCDRTAWLGVSVMLSDRVTGPTSLAVVREFISLAWKFESNPLPALRKRLGQWGWTCSSRCWAKDPECEGEWKRLKICPHVTIGASTIFFHPIGGWK